MEQMAKNHTNQLSQLESSVNGLKNDSVRISEMQKASSDKVQTIFDRHKEFEATQHSKFEAMEKSHKKRAEDTEKSIRELEKTVAKNTLQHAEESGRHQEREKWTRILVTFLIIASTIVSALLTVYLKQ